MKTTGGMREIDPLHLPKLLDGILPALRGNGCLFEVYVEDTKLRLVIRQDLSL